MILDNAISRGRMIVTSSHLSQLGEDVQIIDACRSPKDFEKKGHIERTVNIPHTDLREKLKSLDPNKPTVIYCNKRTTGNSAQNILIDRGFTNVYNLSGDHKFYSGNIKKKVK